MTSGFPYGLRFIWVREKSASVLSSWDDLPTKGPRAMGTHWLESHWSHVPDAIELDLLKGAWVSHLWMITPRLVELGNRPSQSQHQTHAC